MGLLVKNTILLMVLISSCSAIENKQEFSFEIFYKAETRGSSIYINYKENRITLKSNTEDKSIDLNNKERKKLHNIISKIKLSEIKDLIAPSNKRFTDGALIASFTIKKGDTNFVSSNFDHDNPPKEMQELYQEIKKLVKKKVEN